MIPESISALGKSMWWTIAMWIAAYIVLYFMCQVGEVWVAFAACTCLVLVGVLPLKEGSKNIAHYVFAMCSAVLSQLWVGLVGDWFLMAMCWVMYLILLPLIRSKWCFFAEVLCVINVIVTIILW